MDLFLIGAVIKHLFKKDITWTSADRIGI